MTFAKLDRCGLFAFCFSVLCGCGPSPETACTRLSDAIWEADGPAVYDALLLSTQWSISTVHTLHRDMAAEIQKHYPPSLVPGARARLYAAGKESGRAMFGVLYHERYAPAFRARVAQKMPVQVEQADVAFCGPQAGNPFRLARSEVGDRTWGLTELDREWEDAKLRAFHDRDTVQKNVSLYRRIQANATPQPPPQPPAQETP
jgi:hypothetical protein